MAILILYLVQNNLKYGQIVYDISENLGVLVDEIYGETVEIPGRVVSNDEICVDL